MSLGAIENQNPEAATTTPAAPVEAGEADLVLLSDKAAEKVREIRT
jgi:hypothetical protein